MQQHLQLMNCICGTKYRTDHCACDIHKCVCFSIGNYDVECRSGLHLCTCRSEHPHKCLAVTHKCRCKINDTYDFVECQSINHDCMCLTHQSECKSSIHECVCLQRFLDCKANIHSCVCTNDSDNYKHCKGVGHKCICPISTKCRKIVNSPLPKHDHHCVCNSNPNRCKGQFHKCVCDSFVGFCKHVGHRRCPY